MNLQSTSPAPEVPCTCEGAICGEELQSYQCEVCLRVVPWCFGGNDDFPDSCDDCAAAFIEVFGD